MKLAAKRCFRKPHLLNIQSLNRRKIIFLARVLGYPLIQRRRAIMNNLFDATVASEVKTRLKKLQPQTERLWGQMTVAQMLAHCAMSMQ
jgi:hypothetical protein